MKFVVYLGHLKLFKLSKYTQAFVKDYKRLTFYLISLGDMEECEKSESDSETPDNRSADWSRFSSLCTYNATTTSVLPSQMVLTMNL